MAGLKKARRKKEKQYKTRQLTPQQQANPEPSAAPAPNPFVMGTSNYGVPPKE